MKEGIGEIIGKSVVGVIVAENYSAPKQRVFLVFSDDTYFEFYGDGFSCTGGVNRGGLEKAMRYANAMSSSTIRVYPAEMNENDQSQTKTT